MDWKKPKSTTKAANRPVPSFLSSIMAPGKSKESEVRTREREREEREKERDHLR